MKTSLTVLPLLMFAARGTLQLPALPYDYDALEPVIDTATMRLHHLAHHKTYTDKTNAAIAALRANATTHSLSKQGVDHLLRNLHLIPPPYNTQLRNFGGGFVNHELFWRVMAPPQSAGGIGGRFDPESEVGAALVARFGSLDSFQGAFTAVASSVFGSGWTWLELNTNLPGGAVFNITTTHDQDTPAMEIGRHPLLALDLWEHAFYLKYQNRRAEYVASWWTIVNWEAVNQNFLAARGRGEGLGREKVEL